YDNRQETLESILNYKNISRFVYNSYSFEKQFELNSGQYIDFEGLTTLYINLKHTKENHIFSRFSSSLLFSALAACFLFFLLYVVRLRSFFLSIPIWGILNIIIGFILASTRMGDSEGAVIMGAYLFMLIVLVAINWWFLRDPKLSLKPLHISISMTLIAIPAIGLLTLGLIQTSFSTKIYDDCNQYINTTFLNGWLTNEYIMYFTALVCILCSFYWLRIYKSKPE
ncbi:MAG: hypothetical protein KJ941_04755, partial [Bacteroidetes bacterium]|nr:hypothetical protein [Bacteroidota bacterium]